MRSIRPVVLAAVALVALACGGGEPADGGAGPAGPNVGWVTILEPTSAGAMQVERFVGAGATLRVAGEAFVSPQGARTEHVCVCVCGLLCLSPDPRCVVCDDVTTTGVSVRVANRTVGVEKQAGRAGTHWSADLPLAPGPNQLEAVAEDAYGNSGSALLELTVVTPGPFQAIAAGDATSFALDDQGALFSCGDQLLGAPTMPWRGVLAEAPTGASWVHVAASLWHALAVRADGTLWAWGSNDLGQLGIPLSGSVASPTQVGGDADWTAVAAGGGHSLAVKRDGTLWAWGLDDLRQLGEAGGDGGGEARSAPARVGTGTSWTAVGAGYRISFGLQSDGTLWRWGGSATAAREPVRVGAAATWDGFSTRFGHLLAVRSDGTLWSWGGNQYGRLGIGTLDDVLGEPRQVGADADWAAVAAGEGHSLALKADGSLWAWGANWAGQLGLGTAGEPVLVPTRVGTSNDWTAVAAGSAHTLALARDATLWTWGASGALGDGTTEPRSSPAPIR